MGGRYIHNNKIYNLNTSEEIVSYIDKISYESVFGEYRSSSLLKLCKTKKGNWFSYIKCNDKIQIFPKTEEEVAEIFKKINEIELYKKYFGELEEA